MVIQCHTSVPSGRENRAFLRLFSMIWPVPTKTRVRFPSPAPTISSAFSQFSRSLSYECHTTPPRSARFSLVSSPGIEPRDRGQITHGRVGAVNRVLLGEPKLPPASHDDSFEGCDGCDGLQKVMRLLRSPHGRRRSVCCFRFLFPFLWMVFGSPVSGCWSVAETPDAGGQHTGGRFGSWARRLCGLALKHSSLWGSGVPGDAPVGPSRSNRRVENFREFTPGNHDEGRPTTANWVPRMTLSAVHPCA